MLTESQEQIMADTAKDKLVKARMRLLFKHPFFGQMALRMRLIDVTDQGWCPTAATNGKDFFYNSHFVEKLSQEELVFLVGHELGHCIFEHFLRVDNRDKEYWNMAGDYVINLMLQRESIGSVITTVPILLDAKYKGMTTEEVYEDLVKNQKQKKQTVDVHLSVSGDGDGDDDEGSSSGDKDGKGNKPTISKDDIKAISDDIRQAVLQAAAASAGNLPSEISRIIKNLTQSKMDWRQHIRSAIESSIKTDFSWMRPNRKGWHMSAILPGMTPGEEIEVAIGIDTSGSISQKTLEDFLGEVNGIMEQFDQYTIRIWQFDTRVYSYEKFTHDDGKDIRQYEIKGGGGTDFMVNWEFMKSQNIEPRQFIMFTDMMPYRDWGDPNYCDTMFIAHSTKTIKAPFGTTVYYE
jgi:predicted metal-dependent peptidase